MNREREEKYSRCSQLPQSRKHQSTQEYLDDKPDFVVVTVYESAVVIIVPLVFTCHFNTHSVCTAQINITLPFPPPLY